MSGQGGAPVHVHVPVKVTITGRPGPDDLNALGALLRRRLATALSSARSQAAAHRQTATTAQARGPASRIRTTGRAVRRGAPPWRQRTGPLEPGHDWRVLRSLTVTTDIAAFLSVVAIVNGDTPDSIPEIMQRELADRLGERELQATVWLVETLRSTTLDELEKAVTDRFLELAHAWNVVHAISPSEGDHRVLAAADHSGAVAALPSLDRANALRVSIDGELLPGARLIYAALPVPEIGFADVVTTGGLVRRSLTVAQVAPFVDLAAFKRLYLPWDRYVVETGTRLVTLGLMAGVVNRPYTPDTAARAMLAEIAAQLPADPALTRGWHVYQGDDPGLPALARGLIAGQQVVVAVFDLPLDIDTISAARQRPGARRDAVAVRARLATDPTAFHWGRDLHRYLRELYGKPPDTRPEGGTPFQYLAEELDSTGDLDRLIDAADASGEESLRRFLLRQLRAAGYGNRVRVSELRAALIRLGESHRANSYRADAPGAPGAVWLDRKHLVTAGTDDGAVLAEADSAYVVTTSSQQLKPAVMDRVRDLVPKIAIELLREISAGTAPATTYIPESFGEEVFGRAAQQAQLTSHDVESTEIKRSWRVEAVRLIEEYGVSSYLLVLRAVEQLPGQQWTPVGDTFEQTADDFEANLTYWALGNTSKFYQALGLVVTGAGLLVIAWEAEVIGFLIEAAGGRVAVGISVGASELLYFAKVLLGKADLSWENFFLAAADGYLSALGFRVGALATAWIGRVIGMETVPLMWKGIIAQRLAAGAVGGGLSAVAETFLHDLVGAVLRDGRLSGWRTYVSNLGVGAAVGALGEITFRPLLARLGRSAASTAKDIVDQLRTEGVSLDTFAATATGALSRLRTAVSGLVQQSDAGGLYAAFEEHITAVISEWGTRTVALRVLELQGIALTEAAELGVARLASLSESSLSQEAVRRLTLALSDRPGPAVAFLEVIGRLEPSIAERVLRGTFRDDADLVAFVAGLSRYSADQQRAAVQLLADSGLVARPAGAGDVATLLDRQLQTALVIKARAQAVQAANTAAEAEAEIARGQPDLAAKTTARGRVEQDRAAATAQQAAGVIPGSGRAVLPDILGDPEAAAAVDRAFGGPGGEDATLSVGTYYRLPAAPDWEPTAAEMRMMFSSRSGNPVVFRVQGGSTPPQVSKQIIEVDSAGRVTFRIRDEAVFVNVGSLEQAIEWLALKRPGASLVMFEVDAAWMRAFRGIARPERAATVMKVPYTVDIRYAPDQLGIPPQLISQFEEFIVQGTGRVLTFTPQH